MQLSAPRPWALRDAEPWSRPPPCASGCLTPTTASSRRPASSRASLVRAPATRPCCSRP
ncbi:hypothetical protein ACFPRL_07875 [Pseudoclavibacter helvolus]